MKIADKLLVISYDF